MKPTIYIASKTRHAARWRALRDAGIRVVGSWIDEADPSPDYVSLWRRCVFEASAADALIVFAEAGDVLKGGMIEIGAALGAGKPVIQVGLCASLCAGDGSDGSFTHHPLWRRVDSLEEALSALGYARAMEPA